MPSCFLAPAYNALGTSLYITGCKINLYLRIGSQLANGYHTLDTLFIPLQEPFDIVCFQSKHKADSQHSLLTMSCSSASKLPEQNTLTRAYAAFGKATGYQPPLHIHLTKQVPIGAGLGGGSANAAAVLQYLSRHMQNAGQQPPSHAEMISIAATVGADVPFFLLHHAAIGAGIGDKLSPVPLPFANYFLLLVCPAVSISAGWAYEQLDASRKKTQVFTKKHLTSLAGRAISTFAVEQHLQNDFEEIVFAKYPELFTVKQTLVNAGADHALLSGSGSSIFGLFSQKQDAQAAAKLSAIKIHQTFLQQLRAGV